MEDQQQDTFSLFDSEEDRNLYKECLKDLITIERLSIFHATIEIRSILHKKLDISKKSLSDYISMMFSVMSDAHFNIEHRVMMHDELSFYEGVELPVYLKGGSLKTENILDNSYTNEQRSYDELLMPPLTSSLLIQLLLSINLINDRHEQSSIASPGAWQGAIDALCKRFLLNSKPDIITKSFTHCFRAKFSTRLLQNPVGDESSTSGRFKKLMLNSIDELFPKKKWPSRIAHFCICMRTQGNAVPTLHLCHIATG